MPKPQPKTARSRVFKTEGRSILCACSTRHRRFIDDLIHVMSLPAGSRVRLRYGDDVCDPELRLIGYIPSPPISGMRALIAHVGFDEGVARFLPLRVGVVVELQTVGSVTFLEIELGDFVEERMALPFETLLGNLATLQLPTPGNGSKEPSGFFCQMLSSHPEMVSGNDTEMWERIGTRFLKAIGGDAHASFPFVFHISVLRARSRESVRMKDGALLAPPFSRSELHIRTLTSKSLFGAIIDEPIGELSITTNHPGVRLSSDTGLPIDTTRNLLVSGLTARIGVRPAFGALVISARRRSSKERPIDNDVRCVPGSNTGGRIQASEPSQEIKVELPVTVGRGWMRIGAIFAISLAVATHALDLTESGDVSSYAWWKSGIVLISAFAALLMGLKPQVAE